jgi:hypothetical protein
MASRGQSLHCKDKLEGEADGVKYDLYSVKNAEINPALSIYYDVLWAVLAVPRRLSCRLPRAYQSSAIDDEPELSGEIDPAGWQAGAKPLNVRPLHITIRA